MTAPRAVVVSANGTNRDRDVCDALALAGADPVRVTMTALHDDTAPLDDAQLIVLAGGFSHADALGAGTVWALDLRHRLADAFAAAQARATAVLGICNGFQVLTRAGLLPGSLAHNASGSFTCRWVTVEPVPAGSPAADSPWLRGLTPFDCPVAHGEGRYVAEPAVLSQHAALRYASGNNPNGSTDDVAGVVDASGLVLGLMPHPENHLTAAQHPGHLRGRGGGLGLALFRNGVRHARHS